MNAFAIVARKRAAVVGGGGGSFDHHSPVTIDHTQVPATQTDFPVLLRLLDGRFANGGIGGHVSSANGYDIRPYSDSGLTTPLTYELDRYNPSTGEVVMWVKIPSLSSSVDTVIYLAYGNVSLITNGSSTATWTNGFLGVYHLGDGTTLSVNSATGSNNGTNNGATAATGQVDGAANFTAASSQYVALGSGMNPVVITLSAWVKATSFPNSYNTVIARDLGGGASAAALWVKSNGKLTSFCVGLAGNPAIDGTGIATLSTGTWYYLAMTFGSPSSGMTNYVNGVFDATFLTSTSLNTTASPAWIGADLNGAPGVFYWDGLLDEARIASVERSANWLLTEYRNQNAGGTFTTLGTEV